MKTIDATYETGWYSEESTGRKSYRWMQRKSKCLLKGLPIKGPRQLVIIGGHPFPNERNPSLNVYADNEKLGAVEILPFTNTYLFPLKNHSENIEIDLELDNIFRSDITDDERELGIIIEQIKIYSKEAFSLPQVLELETATYCNINPPCVMCFTRIFDKRPYQGEIDNTAFNNLIPFLKEFRTISLHGTGEPLLGKKLFTILDNINTDITYVQFNSNGLLLTEEKSRDLIKKGLKLLDFSIDAASPETYKKIRRLNFNLVINNIKRLAEIKKELRVKYPVIKINMTLMKENLSEVIPFIEMAKKLEAEIVHLGLLNPFKEYEIVNEGFMFNYNEQMLDPNSAIFQKTMEGAKQKAEELGIELILEFPEN
jgi:MoaA/NifB/PqqE/SkfB family radical SAM enzyme